MGLLDGLIGGALGQLGGTAGQQNPLLQVAMQLIQGQQGGLAGLVQLVDKLTPNGAIEQGSIEQALSGLLKSFGR